MRRWKCTVCGKIFEGDAPPVPCPVCHAGAEAFVEIKEESSPARWRCTVCGQIFEGPVPPVPCPVCHAGESAFVKLEAAETQYHEDTDDRYVLVGGGIAALSAAKALRKRNKTAEITMVSAEDHPPYNRPILSDVVADRLPFSQLLLEKEGFFEENEIKLLSATQVQTVDTQAKTVALSNGQALPYTRLLLATGANAFNPIRRENGGIPVQVLRSFEDAQQLVRLAAGKRVVLVGGGILGLEAAMALHRHSCSITVVEYAPRLLSLQADEAVSLMLRQKLESMGMTVLTGLSVVEATAAGAVLSNGTVLEADLVLASMGVRSEITLATAVGLPVNRGIIVDEFMRTSHPDIWAAGDCAEYGGRVQAMAGDTGLPYLPFVPATLFEYDDFSIFSVGSVGATTETVLYEEQVNGLYRRLFLQQGKLTGALFIGGNPGAKAVEAVTDHLPLKEVLPLLS